MKELSLKEYKKISLQDIDIKEKSLYEELENEEYIKLMKLKKTSTEYYTIINFEKVDEGVGHTPT